MERVLTGVQSTGRQHFGNIMGAILPAIEMAANPDNEAFLFIADMHSRSEEHTSELQSHPDLVCRLLLEKKKTCPHDTLTLQNPNPTLHMTYSI